MAEASWDPALLTYLNVSFRVRPDLFKKGFSSFLCFFLLGFGFYCFCLFVCLFAGFVSGFPLFICEALWRGIDWIYGRWVLPSRTKLVFPGIIERTFLNRLAHHLQLPQGSLHGPCSTFQFWKVKAVPHFADSLSVRHDKLSPACVACGLLQVEDKWVNIT